MKQDGRGKHGNCGAKKKDDPRNKPVSFRLNSVEYSDYISCCELAGLSMANFAMLMIDMFKKNVT